MQPRIKGHLGEMEDTVKHISAMVTSRRINQLQESRLGEVGMREREYPMDGTEKAIFPVDNMPTHKTRHFAGRGAEIDRIHTWLGGQENTRLKTYLIYGRRGIGKTQIALEYFARHRSAYDAVFWIACETGASLRQSFAEIATALELDGADKNGHFEENLMKVLRWLRHTRKRWLLIYDNAERENLLKGFWPAGTRGSILLTSRTYYNFFEDDQRQGETVPLFTEEESHWSLMAQLGPEWEADHFGPQNVMCEVEKAAARTLLEKTGGLPLAINHAARLILNTSIGMKRAGGRGDDTIHGFLELFGESLKRLPPRQSGDRHPLIQSLDTIWSIAFDALSSEARAILSVLALVSPDVILIDIFMPSDLDRLTKKLSFCRTAESESNGRPSIQLASKMGSAELQRAIAELEKQGMITKSGRNLAIHREVQEAVNYQSRDDLKESFDAAVELLYDAFPKQTDGRPMTEDRDSCRRWIQHVIALANKYNIYAVGRPENDVPLKGMASIEVFVKLLANSAWYLFEIADYDECLNIIRTARAACEDPTSLDFAHLLNTEGTTYFEQNKLRLSRDACEAARRIREEKLNSDSAEMAIVLGNLGNIESAQGNLEEALELLTQAARIRERIGDEAAVMLALNYLQIGRVYFLKGEYTRAYIEYQRCEGVFLKKAGRNGWFLADLYYAYGNLEFAQRDYSQAGRSFERARRVCMDYNPLHPLTAAVYYKIACTEFEQDHHTKALGNLEKAMNIAEVRSSNVIDGTLARIIWKKAEILLDSEIAGPQKREEARASKNEMELRQREIAEAMGVDLRGYEDDADREASFDLLVAGYYR
jgi:tetratricopeptide (TPR) repeat protein